VSCDVATKPQQQNRFDCGVFIAMLEDFILDVIPFLNFNQSDFPMFKGENIRVLQKERYHLIFNTLFDCFIFIFF